MAGDELNHSLFATIGRKATIKIGANRFDKVNSSHSRARHVAGTRRRDGTRQCP